RVYCRSSGRNDHLHGTCRRLDFQVLESHRHGSLFLESDFAETRNCQIYWTGFQTYRQNAGRLQKDYGSADSICPQCLYSEAVVDTTAAAVENYCGQVDCFQIWILAQSDSVEMSAADP